MLDNLKKMSFTNDHRLNLLLKRTKLFSATYVACHRYTSGLSNSVFALEIVLTISSKVAIQKIS